MDIQDILQGQLQQGKLRLPQQDYVQTQCHKLGIRGIYRRW